MQQIPIGAQLRQETGKGPNRGLRANGFIPVILYGQEIEAVKLALNEHDFMKIVGKLGGEMVMFKLTAEGSDIRNQLAVIREIQRDPVTEKLIHIDFMRVDLKKPIDVHVAAYGHGTPVGVREGGILEQINRTVHLRCLPGLIPPQIDVNCDDLAIGDAFRVGDLKVEEGIQILSPESFVLFHVVMPRRIEEEVVEGEEAEEGVEGEEGEEGEGEKPTPSDEKTKEE